MAWAKTTKVGCAKYRCDVLQNSGTGWNDADYFVCNYAPAWVHDDVTAWTLTETDMSSFWWYFHHCIDCIESCHLTTLSTASGGKFVKRTIFHFSAFPHYRPLWRESFEFPLLWAPKPVKQIVDLSLIGDVLMPMWRHRNVVEELGHDFISSTRRPQGKLLYTPVYKYDKYQESKYKKRVLNIIRFSLATMCILNICIMLYFEPVTWCCTYLLYEIMHM